MFENNLSILLSTYNADGFIENTLNRIINQTTRNFELIIVDDASTDTTIEKIKSIIPDTLNCSIIINSTNLGVSRTREILIQNASFKYITFLDHDDILSLDFVEHFISLLNQYGDLDLISTKYKLIHSFDRKIDLEETLNKENLIGNLESQINMESIRFPTPIWAKVFNKSLFDIDTIEKLKIISEVLYLEDISLPFYLLGKNINTIASDKITYYHYRHDNNQSSRNLYGHYFINQISLGEELLKLFELHSLSEVYDSYLIDYTSLLVGIFTRYKFSKENISINIFKLERNIIHYSKRIRISPSSSYKALLLKMIAIKPVIFVPFLRVYYNVIQHRWNR